MYDNTLGNPVISHIFYTLLPSNIASSEAGRVLQKTSMTHTLKSGELGDNNLIGGN